MIFFCCCCCFLQNQNEISKCQREHQRLRKLQFLCLFPVHSCSNLLNSHWSFWFCYASRATFWKTETSFSLQGLLHLTSCSCSVFAKQSLRCCVVLSTPMRTYRIFMVWFGFACPHDFNIKPYCRTLQAWCYSQK